MAAGPGPWPPALGRISKLRKFSVFGAAIGPRREISRPNGRIASTSEGLVPRPLSVIAFLKPPTFTCFDWLTLFHMVRSSSPRGHGSRDAALNLFFEASLRMVFFATYLLETSHNHEE